MVFFSYKIKKMIAFKWMVERKQEPPWGGIKQLNFPLLSASPTTSLNGKGHRTLQQNSSETRCTTLLGHDMLPGQTPPTPRQRPDYLWPDRSSEWLSRWHPEPGEEEAEHGREQLWLSYRNGVGVSEHKHRGSKTWTGKWALVINTNIKKQYLHAALSTLHTLPHLSLTTALRNR